MVNTRKTLYPLMEGKKSDHNIQQKTNISPVSVDIRALDGGETELFPQRYNDNGVGI
jgi:hypothetical protein